MKKEKLQAAVDAVLNIHAEDPDMGWCLVCETTYPCLTVETVRDSLGLPLYNPCPFSHSHTKHWCGYPLCRES